MLVIAVFAVASKREINIALLVGATQSTFNLLWSDFVLYLKGDIDAIILDGIKIVPKK
jgi:hypothetical protein